MHLVGSRDWRSPGGWALSVAARSAQFAQHLLASWDSIHTRLVLLALVATAPLMVLLAINATQDVGSARTDAQMEALRVAQMQANLIDEHLDAVDTLLRGVSASLVDRPLDDPTTLALLEATQADLPPSYSRLFIGQPSDAPMGVLASRPIRAADGSVKGLLSAETRLDRLPRLERRDLPAGSSMMVT